MNLAHKPLFQTLKINNLEIKNRYVMSAMGSMACDPNGVYNDDSIEYYARRAQGGIGLIITGANWCENDIEKHKPGLYATPVNDPDAYIKKAAEMTEIVHSFGAKIFMQITAGLGRSAIPRFIEGNTNGDFVAPSPITNIWDPYILCREIKTEEVENIVNKMAETAEIAKLCDFDGIEVHAMHEGYLLDCFTMAYFNKRKDKYGGDTKGRLTFPIEILDAIKEKCGHKFPVIMRFGVKSFIKAERKGALPGEEFLEIGRDIEEALEMAVMLEKAGYDAFNVDVGTYDSWYWAHPPMYFGSAVFLPFAEKVKEVVKVPVIAAGRMDDPDIGAKAIAEGRLDCVALARPVLADPDLVNKVRSGELEFIRPCLSCYDGCITRKLYENKGMSCAVNPQCNRERHAKLTPAKKRKKVVVIGGGVAGMEAARVSAIRGHTVNLFETESRLGGNLRAAGVPDFKKDDLALVAWYEKELKRNNVKIFTNHKVGKEEVLNEQPDVVFIAAGSKPIKVNVPGHNKDSVCDATEMLSGNVNIGDNIVIIGGGLVGAELALWLSQKDKKVTVVEALSDILSAGTPLAPPIDMALRDLLSFNKVNLFVNAKIVEVNDEGAIIETKEGLKSLKADNVVFAVGFKKEDILYDELVCDINEIYNIGDSRVVKNIRRAIWDAFEVARSI